MSWSYQQVGTVEAVVKNLSEYQFHDEGGQGEEAKQFILNELSHPRTWGNIVRVEASGHSSKADRGSLSIKIETINALGVNTAPATEG